MVKISFQFVAQIAHCKSVCQFLPGASWHCHRSADWSRRVGMSRIGNPPTCRIPFGEIPMHRDQSALQASLDPYRWQCQDAPISLSLLNVFNPAFHIKVTFGHLVMFAVQNFLEPADRLGDRHLFAWPSRENFGDAEGLAQEPLNLARAEHGEFAVRRELI